MEQLLPDLLHSETDSESKLELELKLETKLMAVDEMEMQAREAGRKGREARLTSCSH